MAERLSTHAWRINIHGANWGLCPLPERREEKGLRAGPPSCRALYSHMGAAGTCGENSLHVRTGRPRVPGPEGVHHSTQTNPRGLLIGIDVHRQVL